MTDGLRPDPFDDLDLNDDWVAAARKTEPPAGARLSDAARSRNAYEERQVQLAAEAWRTRARRRPRRRGLAALVAVAALSALASYWVVTSPEVADVAEGIARQISPNTAAPTPKHATSDVPLGRPPVVDSGGTYAFISTARGGRPVTYDPCRPIRYVINEEGGPPGGTELIHDAAKRTGELTGLVFEFEGFSDEGPTLGRKPYQQERYGDRWAPVLVAWTDASTIPDLLGLVAGIGGSTQVVSDGQPVYVTGQIALDRLDVANVLARPTGTEQTTAIISHEFGHLVGLDHVSDPNELMHADNVGRTEFGAGDKAGLAQLGSGPCLPRL